METGMNKIPNWAKSMKWWAAFVLGVFALYGGAATIGLDIPRWTWISEHRALAGEVSKDRVELYKGQVEHLENRHTDVIIKRSQLKAGTPLYNTLLRKEKRLERQLKEAEAKLKKVRGF